MGKPGPAPDVTPADVLDVFDERDDTSEPLTAPEVADAVGCSRRTALDKLQALADRGDIKSKKVGGRAVVWWRPDDTGRAAGEIAADDPLFAAPAYHVDDPVDVSEIDDVVYPNPDPDADE